MTPVRLLENRVAFVTGGGIGDNTHLTGLAFERSEGSEFLNNLMILDPAVVRDPGRSG